MKNRIRRLSPSIANQIAAGEVVQDPSSIIKELIENSIDAGADSIRVEIKNGGKSFIRVTDNGIGMSYDDALLSIERHATSKLRSVADLDTIATYGFRGEALPSIASVARVQINTTHSNLTEGVKLMIEGGTVATVTKSPPIKGSDIIVRDLFYNTPVRKKFLKSEPSEATKALEMLYVEALSNSNIEFKFVKNGKTIYHAPSENILERIKRTFSDSIEDNLVPLKFKYQDCQLEGFISRPESTFSNRKWQYTFVNSRYIKDRFISFAISEGYRSLMPKGRFPALFLNIATPVGFTDVNTHPAKTEVRFSNNQIIIELVRNGIINLLTTKLQSDSKLAKSKMSLKEESSYPINTHIRPNLQTDPPVTEPVKSNTIPEDFYFTKGLKDISTTLHAPATKAWESNQEADSKVNEENFSLFSDRLSDSFRVIGQLFNTFILLEDNSKLIVIDQHTAHERVLFEQLSLKYQSGAIPSQTVLLPTEFKVSVAEAEFIRRNLDELKRFGYLLEEFSEVSFLIRAVPAILKTDKVDTNLTNLLDDIAHFETKGELKDHFVDIINMTACKGAVKANDIMKNEEIHALISDLKKCKLPYSCPHGRPITFGLDKEDLLKGFLRK
ncbi:MAG: DNA mismatch repair endonuclease MutL [Nitrospinota bacterium]